ncbi:phage terminase small subunit [Jeongeupia chitinilytica]|uniref:Bacteriophage terminase endonuclease subunit n=1 Tax=Jeongeupia chitinilytica TaxID=1041641 RepID=A0ABQ3GZC8_9NEIS|nr:terminase endonuclease subunit [Jeongeupia chitinilytica]GHD59888.1 bacteriophage terminase endonuclease subunit [Jeongeupia chitinilytica]
MTSPAKAHFQRAVAAIEAAGAGNTMRDATGYELMLAKLSADRRRLKQVQSIERKIVIKREELLPEYVAYIDGVLAAGRGAQDDVLMSVMVWRVDAGDIAGALAIARYALQHKLTMPDQYERTTACLIAEEIAESALAASGNDQSVDATILHEVAALVADEDMPDEVRAKLHKAIGYALEKADPAEALTHLNRALQLHDKCGVKKDIERIEREMRKAAAVNAPPTGEATHESPPTGEPKDTPPAGG